MNLLGAKVRFLRRIFADLVLEAFKLALSDICEIPSLRNRSRLLVEENRHVKFLSEFLPESTGWRNALLHRHTGQWDERDNINCAHSWMLSLVMSQVDELDRLLACCQSSILHGSGLTHEAYHGPVVIRVGLHIEERYPRRSPYGVRDGFDDLVLLAFTEVGNTFD